jgi:hypothetical protein
MAYAVSRWPLIMETWVSPCWICGGQSGIGTDFSLSSSIFPCQYYSTLAARTHVYHQGMNIRFVGGHR